MTDTLKILIESFSTDHLAHFFRRVAPVFRPGRESLDSHLEGETSFDRAEQVGILELPDSQTVLVGAIHVSGELTARSSKRSQYGLAKRILKDGNHNAGIFAFHDDAGCFRLSLVTLSYHGTRRKLSSFRRYTFFIDPLLPNKTFVQQMARAKFSTLVGILETFSLEAVSDEFYKAFKPRFDALAASVEMEDSSQGASIEKSGPTPHPPEDLQQDFALLFAIRIIFLGFVQKKGWLGSNPGFLKNFWEEYRQTGCTDAFYREWLKPLFFEALNSPPGRKVAYGHAPFSEKTQTALQMAPYLNGELFKRKQGVDDQGLSIPDGHIGDFFEFLFQYNFTVQENELFDEELELNPEFLGIIFERITNMDQGAVYTPRVEVDLMCRLALIKWLEQRPELDKKDLYHLFFREAGASTLFDEYQKQGDFSSAEIRILIEQLESVTVCDPSAGSGAFEVGMLQVLDQLLENLYHRSNTPSDLKETAPTSFERKKAIIANSLYGVEVKRWAVWINHLRLWLTLFVEMSDDCKDSITPLLPNLTFKVRTGDSLVQRLGGKTFPVRGHANLPPAVKRQITDLKKSKRDFFNNQNREFSLIEQEELLVFRAILDAEIMSREKQILQQRASDTHEQETLLTGEIVQTELDFSRVMQARCAELKAEIADLVAQRDSLREERPFIWSIEFAEIFFDRGGFDIIIGNPPYVRQEEISDPCGVMLPKEYKQALLEMVQFDYPCYFTPKRKPNGRSDLYTYFYIRSLHLLNPRGVHVFICSNSWLDVGYGAWLQEFLLQQARLDLVIDNHAKRSFARADINTVITVTGASRAKAESSNDHVVRFVAFKQPFEEVVFTENLLEIDSSTITLRNDRFRVYPITVDELLQEGAETAQDTSTPSGNKKGFDSQKYVGDKWGGKYLRAPDIFFTILEKGKGKLVRLGDIAEVRFGIKSGANDFFYLEPLGSGSQPGLVRVCNGAGWEGEIEEEFLKPVIKSPRECRTITIKPENLKYRIFMCHKSKAELHGTKALEYIEWGEEEEYQLRLTLLSRRQWWNLGLRQPGMYLWPMIHNDRLALFINSEMVQVDHNLFEITPKYNRCHIISLFSVVAILVRELFGRANLGEGALKTEGIDICKFPSLSINDYHPENLHYLEIKSIFTECGIDPKSEIPIAEQTPNPLPDRKALDDIVFDALGLTDEERQEVYRAVCQLVWERISKAKSVCTK